ncbi:hypothetical protein PLESTB_000715300 [Pleodorina starrii]|uniref:Major facilitator superfamily (MFS) profile domain-containing protein n=1 Tax=Pleodorina starrii TaxID=330485 RepID=A0A9W6EWV6_9CHLO|nr:hypothetical protein PLESTB_000059400 [Pleodorina starrii]GLC53166.1 hypothetical protein PLESTB_000715300 [Pleodorina starrii]
MARRNDVREQLVPQNGSDKEPSCSPIHSFPRYELPLPGTMPSTDRTAPPSAVVDTVGNGDDSTRDGSLASSKGAVAIGSMSSAAPGPGPGPAAAAATAAAPAELHSSPRAPLPSAGDSSAIAAMEIQEALLPLQPPVPFEHPISLPRRRWMVFMFCLVAALLFADQNLLAPNLTAAAHYFGLSERQKDTLLGGALMAAFFAVGAPAALLVGWLTDRGDINRRTLLFWVVVVGETPCLLTYWVRSYWQFFLLRALTGVAVGGCFPLVFSLLGDLYPPGRRVAVSAVVQIATGIGLAAGQALSGSIGPATNWRLPFVVVAAPSLAVALLMLLTTWEPPRGAFEEALRERYSEGLGSYEGSISWSKLAALLRCPSNVIVIGQGLPGSLPWGMVLTYFNDFLAQQKGFTVQAATGVLLFFGGGGALGVIGGGAGGQWLYNKRKEYQALLAGGCVLLGIAPLYVLINADLQRLGLGATCFLAALGGAVASVAGPNLRSVMLNVNEPETRGVALALQSMTDDLGKGLGPVLVAGLIHALGREGAFNVATAGWIPCGLMLSALACCMRRDEAAMQTRLARSNEALQAQAAERASAAAAAAGGDGDGGGGEGGGITVVLPPPSPPSRSEGSAQPPTPPPQPPAADTVAAVAALRREERRLAKVRLLAACDGGGGGGDSSSSCDHSALPLSSSAAELEVDEQGGGRWGRGGSGRGAGAFAARAAERGPLVNRVTAVAAAAPPPPPPPASAYSATPTAVPAPPAPPPPPPALVAIPNVEPQLQQQPQPQPQQHQQAQQQAQQHMTPPPHPKPPHHTTVPPHPVPNPIAHPGAGLAAAGPRPPPPAAGTEIGAETGSAAGAGPGTGAAVVMSGAEGGRRVQGGGGAASCDGAGDASSSGGAGGAAATAEEQWPARAEAASWRGTGGPALGLGGSVGLAASTAAGSTAGRQDAAGFSGAPAHSSSAAASSEGFWGSGPQPAQQQQPQQQQQQQPLLGPAFGYQENGMDLNGGLAEVQGVWGKPPV